MMGHFSEAPRSRQNHQAARLRSTSRSSTDGMSAWENEGLVCLGFKVASEMPAPEHEFRNPTEV